MRSVRALLLSLGAASGVAREDRRDLGCEIVGASALARPPRLGFLLLSRVLGRMKH